MPANDDDKIFDESPAILISKEERNALVKKITGRDPHEPLDPPREFRPAASEWTPISTPPKESGEYLVMDGTQYVVRFYDAKANSWDDSDWITHYASINPVGEEAGR